jgi:hypothetical protein
MNEDLKCRSWLLELMGDHDFTIPTEAFNELVDALAASGVAAPATGSPVFGYAMALNEVALKLRKRYEMDALSTPLWAEFETWRNKMARSVSEPTPSQPVAADAPAEVLEDAMAMVQDFGDAMLKRGILSGTSDAKGYAKSFDEAKAAKDAVCTFLARRLAAPVEVQGVERQRDEARHACIELAQRASAAEAKLAMQALAGRPAPAAETPEDVRLMVAEAKALADQYGDQRAMAAIDKAPREDNVEFLRSLYYAIDQLGVFATRPAAPLSEVPEENEQFDAAADDVREWLARGHGVYFTRRTARSLVSRVLAALRPTPSNERG